MSQLIVLDDKEPFLLTILYPLPRIRIVPALLEGLRPTALLYFVKTPSPEGKVFGKCALARSLARRSLRIETKQRINGDAAGGRRKDNTFCAA